MGYSNYLKQDENKDMTIQKKARKRIIILGGGLAGLSVARILSKKNQILILEKLPVLGGLAASFKQEAYWIPYFYHHVIKHNSVTQKYLQRYNLLACAVWKKIKVVIALKGRIHDISNPLGLLRFNAVNLLGRLRFGIFGLYILFFANPEKIPDELDARTWLMKLGGHEVTNIIFNNLYARNKFNIDLSDISAKQLAWRLKEREVYDPFTYPPKGLQSLIDHLEKEIEKNNGTIIKNCRIQKVDLKKRFVEANGRKFYADKIINTIPTPELLKICKNLTQSYENQLRKIRYCPAVCVVFGTKDFLDKRYYWINVLEERIHTIFQHSVLYDKYLWKVNWALRYGGSEEDLNLSDQEITRKHLKVVRKYFPKVKILWTKVTRTKYGAPIYDKDYSKCMPNYKTPIKGFFNAGIQVTFPKIRNMNSALESGEKVAKIVTNDINKDAI